MPRMIKKDEFITLVERLFPDSLHRPEGVEKMLKEFELIGSRNEVPYSVLQAIAREREKAPAGIWGMLTGGLVTTRSDAAANFYALFKSPIFPLKNMLGVDSKGLREDFQKPHAAQIQKMLAGYTELMTEKNPLNKNPTHYYSHYKPSESILLSCLVRALNSSDGEIESSVYTEDGADTLALGSAASIDTSRSSDETRASESPSGDEGAISVHSAISPAGGAGASSVLSITKAMGAAGFPPVAKPTGPSSTPEGGK